MSGNDPIGSSGRGGKAVEELAKKLALRRTRKLFRIVDPCYLMSLALCWPLLQLPLNSSETNIIELNLEKFRFVLWVTLALSGLAFIGISKLELEYVSTLVTAFLAPTIVTGGAWFAITFGGVQEKLIAQAINLTKWMFAAFLTSLTCTNLALIRILPIELAVVFFAISLLLVVSAVTYDNVDSLKIGLDYDLRRHGWTMMAKLGIDGVWPPIESEEALREFVDNHTAGKLNQDEYEK